MNIIYTIGYSPFKINDFIDILKKYKITCVIDVRSNPNSKFYTDYNKSNLQEILKINRIIYRNYKNEFGAHQDDLRYFNSNDYLDFNKYAKSDLFQSGIKKIEAGIKMNYVFVLMCAEKNPSTCHRNIMVGREFYNLGYQINNILADSSYETQDNIEKKLVDNYFPNRDQISLFEKELTWEEMVNKSYQFRNSEIGYRKEKIKCEEYNL